MLFRSPSTRVFDPLGDEINVTVEVSWARSGASYATDLGVQQQYTNRKVRVSENMFNF